MLPSKYEYLPLFFAAHLSSIFGAFAFDVIVIRLRTLWLRLAVSLTNFHAVHIYNVLILLLLHGSEHIHREAGHAE